MLEALRCSRRREGGGKKLGLSDLYCPPSWPSEPNGAASGAQRETRELVLKLRVLPDETDTLRRFDAGQFGLLSALTYPRTSLGRLSLCNDWHAWLFFFDDRADEDEAIGKNLVKLRRYMETYLCYRVENLRLSQPH
jgi:hypothetical protein